MASQITSLAIVYSTVYSGADQGKHQNNASLAYVRGWIPRIKGQYYGKCFHLMTSSCKCLPPNTFHEIYSYTQQFTLMLTSGLMHHLVHLATVNNNVLSCNITLLSRTPAISIGMVWFLTWSKFTWHPRIYSDSKYVNIIDFESTILSHCYKDMGI